MKGQFLKAYATESVFGDVYKNVTEIHWLQQKFGAGWMKFVCSVVHECSEKETVWMFGLLYN